MKVAVIGTGYVGLVSGTCFSELGHEITCVDIDAEKIDALQRGEVPIYEPGLADMIAANVEQGRLSFTTDVQHAIENALFVFIAVGTPPLDDGTANLSYVFNVARDIGRFMTDYKIVIIKSTVPVGTSKRVREVLRAELSERGVEIEFDVVSNPEFLREGSAIDDFMNPDRIVIGSDDPRTSILVKELYASFVRDDVPIITMTPASSEMTKYAANCFLATKISFINEMAAVCEKVGADIEDIRVGIGSDSRIGYHFISPGIGYGGSCFPKDVKALISTATSKGYTPELLKAVESVNKEQKGRLVELLKTYFDGGLKGRKFAMWGLAFKPETDDIREAPSLVLIQSLLDEGALVSCYDPQAMAATQKEFGAPEGLDFAEGSYEALEGCDALLIVTEWALFRNPDFERIKKLLNNAVIFDGRNIYSPDFMKAYGFDYFAVGRAPILGSSANS